MREAGGGLGLSPGRLPVPQRLLLQQLQPLRGTEAGVGGARPDQRVCGLGVQLQPLGLQVGSGRASPAGALVRRDACGTEGEQSPRRRRLRHWFPGIGLCASPFHPPNAPRARLCYELRFADEKLRQVQSSRACCRVGAGSGRGALLPTHTPHISSVHPSPGTGNLPGPGPANSGKNSVLSAQPVRPGGTPDPAHQLCQGIQVWDSRFTFCDLHEASEPRTRQMS